MATDSRIIASRVFAEILPAYISCDRSTQAEIRRLVEIVNSRTATADGRQQALGALAEILFPCRQSEASFVELEDYERRVATRKTQLVARLDREEAYFAERLSGLLRQKGMSQAELARRIGVGQSAISMMLARNCRPQRRTISKIAEALGVVTEDLWPLEGAGGVDKRARSA